jgi:DNA-binding NarL/FixJ family response regulator
MASGGFTVLIVDDSAMFTQRVSRLLHDCDCNLHPVLQAHDYEKASEWLLKTKIDLVLLDISLPGKSGIELLKLIRKNYSATKVLMISNHANEYYKQACLSIGADDFFDKSLDFEQMTQKVQQLKNESFARA